MILRKINGAVLANFLYQSIFHVACSYKKLTLLYIGIKDRTGGTFLAHCNLDFGLESSPHDEDDAVDKAKETLT